MKKYYVYAHSKPSGEVFYVGKGSDKRLFTTGNRSEYWKRIVKKHGYTASILEECDDELQAYDKEIFWIAHYKSLGQCLANFTIGGDGVNVEKRWWNKKISKSLTGKKRPSGIESKSYKHIDNIDDIKRLYLGGIKSPELAEIFGLSMPTIISRLRSMGVEIKPPGREKRAFYCVEDGKQFKSLKEAANEYGLFIQNIQKVLNGKYRTTGKKTFKYI